MTDTDQESQDPVADFVEQYSEQGLEKADSDDETWWIWSAFLDFTENDDTEGGGPMTRPYRPHEFPHDRCVTGPHEVDDEDDERRLIWRCELCGFESTDLALRRGCWCCDHAVMWR